MRSCLGCCANKKTTVRRMKATGCYHSRKTISTMRNQIDAMLSFNYSWPNEHSARKVHYFFIERMGYWNCLESTSVIFAI
jgi:hypothetical protein